MDSAPAAPAKDPVLLASMLILVAVPVIVKSLRELLGSKPNSWFSALATFVPRSVIVAWGEPPGARLQAPAGAAGYRGEA